MDSRNAQSTAADDPTNAFEALRGEVSLLRRAVEGLTAERQNAPDYTPTLDATAKRLGEIAALMRTMADRPAMKLTPDALTDEIAKASVAVRADDRKLIEMARGALNTKTSELDAFVTRARTAQEQETKLINVGCLTCIICALLWMILPGIVARTLPTSWHIPERIAARVLRLNMWDAGQDMMAQANGARWHRIIQREREQAVRPSPTSPQRKR